MTNPQTYQVVGGWAAKGDGFAVHADTEEAAIEKWHERRKYYTWLLTQPPVYEQDGYTEKYNPVDATA